ncbi:hypothetical protein HDV02_005535, partial [Globomyces sp. JEL0801]
NPYIIPFLNVSGQRSTPISRAIVSTASILGSEIQHRLQQVKSMICQKYVGDITIVPHIMWSKFPLVMANPDLSMAKYYSNSGESATWPQIALLRNHCLIEQCISANIISLRGKLVVNQNSDFHNSASNITYLPIPVKDSPIEAELLKMKSLEYLPKPSANIDPLISVGTAGKTSNLQPLYRSEGNLRKSQTLSFTKEPPQIKNPMNDRKSILSSDPLQAMESMLQFMIDNNLVLTDSIITLFLKLYARDGPPESANNLIRYCVENDYQILPKYYDYVVIAYCNNLEPWKALEVIKQAQFDSFPITEHMLIAILSSFAKLKNKSGVAYVLKIVEEKQLPPSQELYTAMMNAYKFINQSENVLVIFNKMNELSETDDSVKPSTYAYSILLDMYSKIEDSGAARSALQQMIEQGKEVNAVHFHSVMDSCRKANDSDTVLVLYEQMKSLGLKPVQETFSILLSTYGFKGDLEKMKKVYDEMVSFNIYPNRFTIGTIISIYMKNSNFQECHHWYKTLESRGMYPSPAILSTMMQCVVLEKREFKDCEFYYQIGESLGIVNLQLIKEFVICDLILNKNIKSSIQLMIEQIKKHDIKIDQTSIDIFSNAILKPKLYQPDNTPIDVNSPVVDGKEQFMMLRKSLESDKLGGQSQNMYDLALSKLR